jgi:hypothetical protein
LHGQVMPLHISSVRHALLSVSTALLSVMPPFSSIQHHVSQMQTTQQQRLRTKTYVENDTFPAMPSRRDLGL